MLRSRLPSLLALSRSRSLGLVPMVVEQSVRGERAFDIFSRCEGRVAPGEAESCPQAPTRARYHAAGSCGR